MTSTPPPADRIEAALIALGRSIEVATPDYVEPVLARIADERRPRSAGRTLRRHVGRTSRLLVAAATTLLALGVTVAVPASRHALASWLGFSGIDVRSTNRPAPTRVVSPTPAPLDAGTPHTLQAARLATSGRLRLPQRLPHPTRVFVLRQNRAVVVTLAYRRADRLRPTPETGYALIVTEIFDAGQPLFEKLLYTNSQAVQVHVHDQVGIFVTGPQEIMNVRGSGPQDGVLYEVSARASANTLIWADQAGTYRLEGNFTRRTAVDLAESFG